MPHLIYRNVRVCYGDEGFEVPVTDSVPLPVTVTADSQSTAAARTSVSASTTTVTLLAANAFRRGAIIFNDSTSALYVALGSGASGIDFTDIIPAATPYSVPFGYQGTITGIWAAAIGSARITSLT